LGKIKLKTMLWEQNVGGSNPLAPTIESQLDMGTVPLKSQLANNTKKDKIK
jgi:hypothetical protein